MIAAVWFPIGMQRQRAPWKGSDSNTKVFGDRFGTPGRIGPLQTVWGPLSDINHPSTVRLEMEPIKERWTQLSRRSQSCRSR